MSMRERANGSNIVNQSFTTFFLWHETEIFRFGHAIFRCYGYLFFLQRTWWKNFYFMLYIK